MIWLRGLFILTPGSRKSECLDPTVSPVVSKNIEAPRTQRIRLSGCGNSPESSPADKMEVTFETPDFCFKILNRLDYGSHPKQSSRAC